MRDIYDIIAEQKVLVDVNIANREVNYVLSTLNESDLYIQEGLGEAMKNAGAKVIELIKKLIEELKKLFGRIKDFLLGNGSRSNKKMKALKNSGTVKGKDDAKEDKDADKGAAEQDKANGKSEGNNYDKEMYKGVDPKKLNPDDLLKGSLRTVNMIKYVEFGVKKELMEDFVNGVNNTAGRYSTSYREVKEVFVNSVLKKVFKGDGSYKKVTDRNVGIVERIYLEIKEPKEPEQIKVRDIPVDVMLPYLVAAGEDGKGLTAFFDRIEKDAYKDLNIIKSIIEKKGNETGQRDEEGYAHVQQVINMVGTFLNFMTTNIFKAFNTLDKIMDTVIEDYMKAYNVIIGNHGPEFAS